MPFKESLKTLLDNVDGGLAATIMGYDGIPIDEYLSGSTPLDLQLLAVEYSSLLRDIRHTVDLLGNDTMEEVSIATSSLRVLIRVINEGFFLILVINAGGNYGKGRYLLLQEAARLKEELS